MSTITLLAHFDGKQILLDEDYELKPNSKLLVTVQPEDGDQEWHSLAMKVFARGYGDDEPDYSEGLIKDLNPDYEGA